MIYYSKLKVIINADDFGLNQTVNSAIKNAILKNEISSTTIMANGEELLDAIIFAKEHKVASYGVHLVLTEGASITNSPILRKYGIINQENQFVKNTLRQMSSIPVELKDAIFNEWNAQIKILTDYNFMPSHADSHHHIHHILFDVFDKVLIANGIKKYRNHYIYPFVKNPKFNNESATLLTKLKRTLLPQFFKYFMARRDHLKQFICQQEEFGLRTTDYFMSYNDFCQIWENKPCYKNGAIVELMCHPGHPNYIYEYNLIKEDSLRYLCKNVEIINFNIL